MICYHGGPVTPNSAAERLWTGRHAFVSFRHPDQIELAAARAKSFALDNGAFTAWKAGKPVTDWEPYYRWVEIWSKHPGCDFAVIPDVIGGSEEENAYLIAEWPFPHIGVPVWHLHESDEWLQELMQRFPKIALGSSSIWSTPGSGIWWERMGEVMSVVCPDGMPLCKLHGLRMMSPKVFGYVPFHSVDSTNVARNIGIDANWKGTYSPRSKEIRATLIADNIESAPVAKEWKGVPR